MSEVATNVLHNVGNMMNSVGVSASMLRGRVDKLPASAISQIAAILNEKGPGLAAWVEGDPAGRALPQALTALGRMLGEAQGELQAECRELEQSLDRIRELICSQQDLAGGLGLVEPVDLAEQVEHALRVVGPETQGIVVERRMAQLAPLETQRHKLLLVLVNLIKNATEALAGMEGTERRIVVTLEPAGENVRLTIADNGIGIEPALLARVFQHGYTTKKGGHGFGLHAAANAATEMQGTLRGASEGPQRGARFVLELPLHVASAPTAERGSAGAPSLDGVPAPLGPVRASARV